MNKPDLCKYCGARIKPIKRKESENRKELLNKFEKRRREIVNMRVNEKMTFDKIAKIIGVSRPRIIQICQFEAQKKEN